jgi:hypothetical protein
LPLRKPELEEKFFHPRSAPPGNPSGSIKLKGLNRATTYALTFEDRPEQSVKKTAPTDGCRPAGHVTDPRASEIVWIE